MKLLRTLLVSALLLSSLVGRAQALAATEKFTSRDTLQAYSLYADLALHLMVADEEMKRHTDFNMLNGAHLRYIFGRSDVDLLFAQSLERDKVWSYNNYLALSSGIMKYNPVDERLVSFRRLYPEAIFIFQNNSYRGLASRYQVGALLYPWSLHLPKFKLNIAVGGVYDWSRWKVNEADKIASSSPEMQEKIRFINSHTPLEHNMYQLNNEFRPMLVLDVRLNLTDVLHLRLSTTYQQSLVSPYSREVINKYPELGKVYPYLLSRVEVGTRVHKYFSLQTVLSVDYENNNLALYDSSWQYNLMVGLAFHLHGREL